MKKFNVYSVLSLLLCILLLCSCSNFDNEQSFTDQGGFEISDFSSAGGEKNPPPMPWDEGIVKFAVNRNDFFYTVAKEHGQELHMKRGKSDEILLAAVQFDAILPSPDGSKVLFSADGEIHIYYYDTQKLWQEEIYGLPDGYSPKTVIWLNDENYIFTAYSENELGGGEIYRAGTGGGRQFADVCISTWSDNLHIEDMISDGEVLTVKAYNFNADFTSHEVLYYIIPHNKVRPHGITLTPENAITAESYAKVHTVDCADIIATPEEIKAVAGGRDFEYSELVAMSSDEIRDKIFKPAAEHYRNFTGLGTIYTRGSVNLNLLLENGEIEEWEFYVCRDERFPTYESFIAETRKYFSKNLAAEYLCEDEYPAFASHNGIFLTIDGVRGGNIYYISTEYSIKSQSDSKIIYLARHKYIKDEFFEIVDFEKATDEQCDFEEHECVFLLEDGRWVFENFSLGY